MNNSRIKVVLISGMDTETELTATYEYTDGGTSKAIAQHIADNCYPREALKLIKDAFFHNAYTRTYKESHKSSEHEKQYKEFLNLLKELD